MIGVVHLVWGPLGAAPLRRFLDSYDTHGAGVDHELVILFNGVEGNLGEELIPELERVAHRLLETPAPLQDLAAYQWAAARLGHDRLCFLNSYSVVRADAWLAKLDGALELPRAGLVGATGSWGSQRSAALDALRLPNPYRVSGRPSREAARRMASEIEREHAGTGAEGPPDIDGRAPRLARLRRVRDHLLHFRGFPSPHLRTNAFMASRATLERLRGPAIVTKMQALRLESGRDSLTRRTELAGELVLVVSSDGDCFEQGRWPQSRTFWQADQEDLLIADNRTLVYTNGGLQRRRMLATFAWGDRAAPAPPGVPQT